MTQEDGRHGEDEVAAEPGESGRRWPPPTYWAKVFVILIGVAGAAAILWTLRSILLVLLASLVLATGLQPAIAWFERRGLKRGWGLAVILLAGLVVMGGLAALLIPFIAGQVGELIERLPEFVARVEEGSGFVNRLFEFLDVNAMLEGGADGEAPAIDPVVIASGIGGTLFNLVTVLVVTPYFAISFPALKAWVVRLLRPKHREDFLYVLNSSVDLIANYIVGNAVISLIAGVVAYVGFVLLDIQFALALAAWVAFTDVIPGVGALLGAAGVAAVVAFQGGPQLIGALILLLVYQQVENYLIAPRVMNRAIDLNPATVIIALLIGGSLAGLVGALLALPVAAMLKIVVLELIVPGRIESLRDEQMDAPPPRRPDSEKGRPAPALMRRISVVGNTGSGKTTMSRAIADALDLPHLELDALHHGPGWAARPDEEMRQAATEFASREKWVIDGNYTSIVADIVWSRADTLVWLDLPRRLVIGRVIRRSLRRVVTHEELWAGNRERWHNLIDPGRM